MSAGALAVLDGIGGSVALAAILAIAYLAIGWPLACWIGRRLAARAIPPQAPRAIYLIAWWNGCTMELPPGIHAANAVVYCCSVQPRARA